MKLALVLLTLVSSMAHASVTANCQVIAVEDSALPLAVGQSVTVSDSGAIVGSTIYRYATITEQTNGFGRAIRVLDGSGDIEIISDTRSNEATLYFTPGTGNATSEVAKLLCQ